MGIIDLLKNLLGLGETYDAGRDGTFDTHDPKLTGSGFVDTDDNDKIDISDIQDPPPATLDPSDTPKEE